MSSHLRLFTTSFLKPRTFSHFPPNRALHVDIILAVLCAFAEYVVATIESFGLLAFVLLRTVTRLVDQDEKLHKWRKELERRARESLHSLRTRFTNRLRLGGDD